MTTVGNWGKFLSRFVILCLFGFMIKQNLETGASFQIVFKMFVQTRAGGHVVTKKLKEA